MTRLSNENPRNQDRIFPYIGGAEINQRPDQAHRRCCFNLSDLDYANAKKNYPDLLKLAEEKVKPERLKQNDKGGKQFWWQFLRPRNELYEIIASLNRVLVCNCGATPHMSFVFIDSKMVFANTLAVLAFSKSAVFTILQSYVHESWTRFLASSMKDDLRYTPSDCCETFPFPPNWEENAELEAIGERYYEFRAALMIRNDEGLTKTYNRFHNPEESSPEIHQLRELHSEMDRAVLAAYGWNDLPTACDYIPDYVEEDKDGNEIEKSIRYRWPDEIRDEVLARLLALNAERAKEEQLTGLAAKKAAKKKPASKVGDKSSKTATKTEKPKPRLSPA